MGDDETVAPPKAPQIIRAPSAREASKRNNVSEVASIHRLRTPHGALMSVLSARRKSLSSVRLLWPRENLRLALESAILLQDQAVFVDILRVLLSYRCVCVGGGGGSGYII